MTMLYINYSTRWESKPPFLNPSVWSCFSHSSASSLVLTCLLPSPSTITRLQLKHSHNSVIHCVIYNIVRLCAGWNPGYKEVFCSWLFEPALFRLLLSKSRNLAGSLYQWYSSVLMSGSPPCCSSLGHFQQPVMFPCQGDHSCHTHPV